MFTGLIGATGVIKRRLTNGVEGKGVKEDGVRLLIDAPYRGLKQGESIAVNGACLTVERVVKHGFTVHAVATTLGRTLIGEWQQGRAVNLERALRASDRLGGHFVQGHVDGIGVVEATPSNRKTSNGSAFLVDIRVPDDVAATTVLHGSITIDGVSLTVNALPRAGVVQISLVPFTRDHTTLGSLRRGDRVHVEADVLGKYVRQLCRSEP
jgi:riboflavin synthase